MKSPCLDLFIYLYLFSLYIKLNKMVKKFIYPCFSRLFLKFYIILKINIITLFLWKVIIYSKNENFKNKLKWFLFNYISLIYILKNLKLLKKLN